MFSSRKWQRVALGLNLLGTIVLFCSFQATSSNLKIVTAPDNTIPGKPGEQTALCAYGSMLVKNSTAGYWMMGSGPCPNWDKAKAAAVVNIEYPVLIYISFAMFVFGFLIQFLGVPKDQSPLPKSKKST